MNLDALLHADCRGLAGITLVAREPFWSEADLPFAIHGAGVLRVEPRPGFRRVLLAGDQDELAVMPDCPDAPGWLVPQEIVSRWMTQHITNPRLDDILLAHPLYKHLVQLDAAGHARGGRWRLVQWTPGIPTHAHIRGPEFLPADRSAPTINRQRAKYANACAHLLDELQATFALEEIELAFAYQSSPAVRTARAATSTPRRKEP